MFDIDNESRGIKAEASERIWDNEYAASNPRSKYKS